VDVEIQAARTSEPHQTRNKGLLQPLPIFRELLQSVRSNHWPECTQHNRAWAKARFQWPGCIRRLRHSGQEKSVFEYIARIGDGRLRDSEAVGVAARNAFLEISPNPGSQPHSLRTSRAQIQIQVQTCCLRRLVGQAAAMDRSSSNDGLGLNLR